MKKQTKRNPLEPYRNYPKYQNKSWHHLMMCTKNTDWLVYTLIILGLHCLLWLLGGLYKRNLILVYLALSGLFVQILMSRAMRKCVFGHMRTAKAQISLRIRAGWSGPLLSANRRLEYYRMYKWPGKGCINECINGMYKWPMQRPGWIFAHAQGYLNLHIVRMF